MSHTAPLNPPILIPFAGNLRLEPVENVALIDFAWQHRARYISEVVDGRGIPTFWNNRHEFALPDSRPYLSPRNVVVHRRQRDRQQVSELVDQGRENISLNH